MSDHDDHDEALDLPHAAYDVRRLSEGEILLLERLLAKCAGLHAEPICLEVIDLSPEGRLQ